MNTHHGKLGENVALDRIDSMMQLSILGDKEIEELHKAIDAYLNTRCESPQWLWALSDALNPVSVPERFTVRDDV